MRATLASLFVVESDKLLVDIAKSIRRIRAGTGYGHILITLKLDRPADVEDAMIRRPEAAA